MASPRHRITVLVVTGAGLVAVNSILAGWTGHIAEGAVKAWITQALSSDNMTDSIKTVTAVVPAVLAIGAVGAAHLTPVPNPAGVTVRALSLNGVTVVAILTGGTHFLAVFTKKAFGAELITARPVPASVAGDAAPLCHLTGLLAFAVPTPVSAVLTVESSRTRFPAQLPTVPWCAGTRAISLVALAVDALALSLTSQTPQPLSTLAASRKLLAW